MKNRKGGPNWTPLTFLISILRQGTQTSTHAQTLKVWKKDQAPNDGS
jgi:hypothetical protein